MTAIEERAYRIFQEQQIVEDYQIRQLLRLATYLNFHQFMRQVDVLVLKLMAAEPAVVIRATFEGMTVNESDILLVGDEGETFWFPLSVAIAECLIFQYDILVTVPDVTATTGPDEGAGRAWCTYKYQGTMDDVKQIEQGVRFSPSYYK